jgi:hypothetical protein
VLHVNENALSLEEGGFKLDETCITGRITKTTIKTSMVTAKTIIITAEIGSP